MAVWSHDPLLSAHDFVGVNDLAFDRDQTFLYAGNTADRQLLRIPVREDGSAGAAQAFVDGAAIGAMEGGPDGIMFDVKGNLYVCTPFVNQVQVISLRGNWLPD